MHTLTLNDINGSGNIIIWTPERGCLRRNTKFGISGERKKALKILYEGVIARNTLMTSNICLVVSIAKK